MTSAELCEHCALPIPPPDRVADVVGGRELAFCCRGCAGAYRIITGAGLGAFYRRRAWEQPGVPDGAFEARFDDARLARFVAQGPEGPELTLLVDGVRCASCVWLVERVLEAVPGVLSVRVNFATHRARIRFDPAAVTPARLLGAVAEIGYVPRPYTPDEVERSHERERRALLYRFGTAVFLSMQLMGYSYGLFAGYIQGMEPGTRRLLELLAWAAATPVVFYSGSAFLANAARGLANRAPGMDLLISLGALVSYGYSIYAVFTGGEVYFDTAAMIVTLLLAGRLLELEARRRACLGVDRILRLVPDTARRLDGDASVDVPAADLAAGDRVLVRPGERFPADGEVLSGETELDEAAVTGESLPVCRAAGQTVTSGTLNLTAAVTVRVTAAGAESFVGRVARLVEEAQARRAPIQRLADRVSALFVPAVILLALATWAGWLLAGADPGRALLPALAVLVVACPCALGLATPTAVVAAAGAGARLGILFRGSDVLEALAGVRLAAFDKTGTLTLGRFRVIGIRPAGGSTGAVLAAAARAEGGSSHPLAAAVVAEAGRHGLPAGTGEGAVTHPGLGVELATFEGTVLVGSRAFLEQRGIAVPLISETEAAGFAGCTEVHAAAGGTHLGALYLEDDVRPEAASVLAKLRALGLRTALLTGDRPAAAERVAAHLEIDRVWSEQPPARKAEQIREFVADGEPVLMVGDGINDAPALSAATVGCAMAGGTDVALETSDLVLTRPDLARIPLAVELARFTLRIVRQNLFWAFAYNLLAVPLAAAGKVGPVHAAAAMALSSTCVLGNSLRLTRWGRGTAVERPG